jgi:hypothetical protein
MKPDIVLFYAGEEYEVFASPAGFRVSGPAATISSAMQVMAETANESYSPAHGSKVAHIAQSIAQRMGARIKVMRMEPVVKGVVY